MDYDEVLEIYINYNNNIDKSYEKYNKELYHLLNIRTILDDKTIIDNHLKKIYREHINELDNFEKLLVMQLESLFKFE